MKRLILSAVAAAGLLAVAPAYADPIVVHVDNTPGANSPFTSQAFSDGTFTGTFSENGIAEGNFAYLFEFQIPANGLGSGSVSSSTTFVGSHTDLDFSNVTFNGKSVPITTNAAEHLTSNSTTYVDSAGLSNVPIAYLVNNMLLVEGISRGAGSFSGELSFVPSAAPEPAAWAMMILGFGVAGSALRSRRRNRPLAYA